MQKFIEVVGNTNTKDFLQNLLHKDGANFILLVGPSGHGKSTLARISAAYKLCENVTEDNEPCGNCLSCKSIFSNKNTPNFLSINVGRYNDMRFVDEFREEVSKLSDSDTVILLEEIHSLEDQPQTAMLDVLDKASTNALIIGTTSKFSQLIPTIRKRALMLKVGLTKFELQVFMSQITRQYPVDESVQRYLLEKNLSPRELETIISNHYLANKTSLWDFVQYFGELDDNTVTRFILGFVGPTSSFARTISGFSEEELKSIIKQAYTDMSRVVQKITFNSGKKNIDYNGDLQEIMSAYSSFELYRLMHYMFKATRSKDTANEIYSIKFQYEHSKRQDEESAKLEEYNRMNRELYGQNILPENNHSTKKENHALKEQKLTQITSRVALSEFGNCSFSKESVGNEEAPDEVQESN